MTRHDLPWTSVPPGAGNNIRNVYESVIFLFAVHPFDVGDVILHQDKDWCVLAILHRV